MKIEDVYRIWLDDYKNYIKDNVHMILIYNRMQLQHDELKQQFDKFRVEDAITIRIRIDGILKTVAKMQKNGRTVFFEDDCEIPSEIGKKIFLLSFKELVSKRGNDYVLCESWTDDDPLKKIREKDEVIKKTFAEIATRYNKVKDGLKVRKDHLKAILHLRKLDEITGNWNIFLVASKYPSILDMIQDKFDLISVYELGKYMKFNVIFKGDKKIYKYEIDKNLDFFMEEHLPEIFKLEIMMYNNMVKFFTMLSISEITEPEIEQEKVHEDNIVYNFVSKEKLVDSIKQKV